ncbi:DUF3488 and transglutaminase-like domain-containing protein [Methylomarinum sp. Ch1-1]|uniref:DUF3488 and transglutaminase-like domain-containing protein n=1 Tax=Methylomarinum roseum TaxID=3067653 RepID=A0AAU7NW72_9GAMM|nr:DUF3488 and transglutaminase-like domain-containing protein [Methylomarinum sp. Ch1-1]MDP4522779.1 DUF3488 and transglutaminase-like domain-containing protein [Methylomarinum sp. Ch1-1]
MALDKRILIFLLVSIGLIALPHINHIPAPLFAFFSLLLTWRFAGIWKPTWLPKPKLVFLLTIAGIGLLYGQHQGVLGRDAGTALFITALGLKLLEIRSPRDIYLITYLAFIVASSQFLYQQSILMAGYTLLVCCVLLATLVAINSRQAQTLAALRTAAQIIAQALPLAAVLFILFPRVEAPRWMLFDDKHQARSGLSDTLEPGSISRLGLSDELAFRVKFNGDLPPPKQRYWRGPVFSYTDGKRWRESKNRYFKRYMDQPRYHGKAYQYTLMMEPHDQPWVYALDMAAEYGDGLRRNAFYQLISRRDPQDRAEYQVTSFPDYNTGYLTKTELKDNLQLPDEPSARMKQLVQRLQGFDAEPEVFIRQLLGHFRNEDFHYTLMPDLMEENPIESFLFENRYGFCSHYATAFVYLMRIAGIPARVVGGYQGGELNEVGGFIEVRQANAHAWAEVWLQGQGWVRYDPTTAIAPQRVEQDVNIDLQIASGAVNFTPDEASAALDWLKRGRQLWNSIDYSWQRWVINYNGVNQSSFLASLGIDNLTKIAYWLVASFAAVSSLLAWLVLRRKQVKTDPAMALYRRFCARLAKQTGIRISTGEGPLSFARRVEKQRPELAERINRITALLIKLRYQPDGSDEDLLQLKQQVRRFKVSSR